MNELYNVKINNLLIIFVYQNAKHKFLNLTLLGKVFSFCWIFVGLFFFSFYILNSHQKFLFYANQFSVINRVKSYKSFWYYFFAFQFSTVKQVNLKQAVSELINDY